MKTDEKGKKTTAAAVSVIAAAGVLVNSMFASPAELTKRDETVPPPPAAVVDYILPDTDPDDDGDDSAVDTDEEKKGRLSFSARMRRRIMAMPQGVRAVIGVPLWGIGWVITGLLSMIWTGVISPALGTVLTWAAAALLVLAAAVTAIKAVFPDMPIKKILNKRNILTVLIGMTLLGAADTVITLVLPDKRYIPLIVKLAGSLAVMASAVIPSIIAENARRREDSIELAEKAEELQPEKERDYRAEVLELVDSIK